MTKIKLSQLLQISLSSVAILLSSTALYGLWQQQYQVAEPQDWEQRQQRNAELISRLEYGKSNLEIMDQLGSADFTEAHTDQDGNQWLLLRYRTQHRRSDGLTSHDETTPLLFKNGKLVEWGQSASGKFAITRL
ncbi:DUF3192 domain-containing protein [Ferrimonas senticii]|uniref:DUF3192 domain-containing protein n=1 Tax=Ferrimonas senticii TaxID=394566 RepID=UPI000423A945|nr:DUF3192 domain-containing protein [Ferrimonas senticii]